jgi:hypothetical protein
MVAAAAIAGSASIAASSTGARTGPVIEEVALLDIFFAPEIEFGGSCTDDRALAGHAAHIVAGFRAARWIRRKKRQRIVGTIIHRRGW